MNTQRRGLEIVFMIFLGVLVAAFVGVGVHTFYAPPYDYREEIDQTYENRREILDGRALTDLPDEERARIRELDEERSSLLSAHRTDYGKWRHTTSIVLIVLATLTMALSLVRADKLPVISSGMLLGGLFTMLYGVGWTVTTGSAISRFIIISIALAIALVMGYVRFVGRHPVTPGGMGVLEVSGKDIGEFSERLSAVEKRIDAIVKELERKE